VQTTTSRRARALTDGPAPRRSVDVGVDVSVIVPVRNEALFLEGTLRQILAQDYDPGRLEVVVIDGDSTDGTPAIVRSLQADHPNLRLLHNPKRLSSAARNEGVRHARGRYVVIVDGHCEVDNPRLIADVVDAFERSGADCLGRPQPLDVTGATSLQLAIAAARASWLGHHPESFVYDSSERFVPAKSVAVAYRRELFDAIGLFDEAFDACEDVEFNHRVDAAGLRCLFTPRIGVRYHPRSSLAGLSRQMARYGRGRMRLLRKHPETFTAPGFVPAGFVLGFLSGPLLSCFSPWLATAYLGTLVLYSGIVMTVSLSISMRRGNLRQLPWLPIIFSTIHISTGAGILREALVGWRKTKTRAAEWTALVPKPSLQCGGRAH
jgi:succinoglycan biosynthesis protein ExoA